MNVSEAEVNVGVITFSDDAHIDFGFNTTFNASELNTYFTYPEINQSTYTFVPDTGNMHWQMTNQRFNANNLKVRTLYIYVSKEASGEKEWGGGGGGGEREVYT